VPSWTLKKPQGSPGDVNNLRDGISNVGPYRLSDASPTTWKVDLVGSHASLLKQLPFRVANGRIVSGHVGDISSELRRWGSLPGALQDIYGNSSPEAALGQLEDLKPSKEILDHANAHKIAHSAFQLASADQMCRVAVRVATALQAWFPQGELLVWAKDFDYQAQYRPVHLLAAAAVLSAADVTEGLTQTSRRRSSSWFSGEDMFTVWPGPLYLDLVDGGTLGWSFETPVMTFVFEFGRRVEFGQEPFDVVSLRHLHSYDNLNYLQLYNMPRRRRVIKLDPLALAGLREWFLAGMNRLAVHLITWENFQTTSAELRPLVQQQVAMTCVRILQNTGHLFATRERTGRQADFWDLLDLYASFFNDDHRMILDRDFWSDEVLTGLETLPGRLRGLMVAQARNVYRRLVKEVADGVFQASRHTRRSVRTGLSGSQKAVSRSAYFARHLDVRRNTLHGYKLHSVEKFRDIAIHDGTLPWDLHEWCRYMFMALIAKPEAFLGSYARLPR